MFKCLGTVISHDGRIDEEIKTRIALPGSYIIWLIRILLIKRRLARK
jgi:hypothetical protein